MANVQLLHGDCLEIMRTMEPNSVDSICTDPPYMLNFMGKAFDKAKDNPAANVDVWAEALRVAKPGAHLLAFGGDRTHHRMMVAIEDAGWEIRTCLYWCFGSGFPKSHRVSQSPMFCQCAEVVRNDESKGRETRTDARTHTEAAFSDGVDCPSDDGYSMNTLVSSQDGYQQDRDSHGEQLHQGQEGDQAFSLQQEYVQAHSHSAARGGDLDRVALHSPFQAQCNDHLSSQDYSRPSLSPGDASGDTQANKAALENISTQTDNGFLADHKSHKAFQSSAYVPPASNYATGFPCCQKCGKPIADGWGTALKPAVEIIVMARKPLIGTVAANVQAWGTGGLAISRCRVRPDTTGKQIHRVRNISLRVAYMLSGNNGNKARDHSEGDFHHTLRKSLSGVGTWLSSVSRDGLSAYDNPLSQDSQGDYPICSHFCDVLARSLLVDDQAFLQRLTDARKHSRLPKLSDVPVCAQADSLLNECMYHLANCHSLGLLSALDGERSEVEVLCLRLSEYARLCLESTCILLPEPLKSHRVDSVVQLVLQLLRQIALGTYTPDADLDSFSNLLCVIYAVPYITTNTLEMQADILEENGRWPANLLLDPEAAALLDQMSGERPNGGSVRKQQKSTNGYEGGWGDRIGYFPHDTGGASRFFARFAHDEDDAPCDVVEATPLRFRYQSKASKRDRDEGLEGMASKGNTFANGTRRRCVEHDSPVVSGANTYSCGCAITYDEPRESVSSRNGHPTVKPTALMQWLVRLVTPPGGTILDPFMGSGSTGKAAMLEGFNFIGVELSEEYLEIARRRIEHAQGQAQQQAHMPQLPLLDMTGD